MKRRRFISMMAAAVPALPVAQGLRLIAHRGGVVDDTRAENSAGAVEEAIARGYWMVEVDVRRSRDGEPVLHHDNTLARYYGESKRVEEMRWRELQQLRAIPGGKPPLHFEELCAICSGKIRLMLDLKGKWEPAFYQRLWRHIEQAKLLQPTWSLGGPAIRPLFDGKVMVSVNRQTLDAALAAGEPVAERYFLFELGSVMQSADIELARQHRIAPVAAINTFRYTMAKRDDWEGAKEDITRLRQLGVTDYQVDSRYEPLFS
jgi:glycerophosphoryl diester phosphodiesterase